MTHVPESQVHVPSFIFIVVPWSLGVGNLRELVRCMEEATTDA